ncbi:MAG: hypothetical protein KA224_00950 [Steroidobacteraceae bacterium]|nr:hypothetical protein [Steroidobacteraceae bacterium]
MTLQAKVARTALDLPHGNLLRVPEFGVTHISINTPGGGTSKSYLPDDSEWAKKNPPPAAGKDDVNFAPEKETVKLKYTLRNPVGAITAARLELHGPYEDAPLWTRDLTPEECLDGEHTIEWDGKVTKSVNFPDEYITVEMSPYKLKLVAKGGVQGDPVTAWTYFHVLVAKLEFELGPKEVLSRTRDRTLWTKIKDRGVPAEGATLELRLVSNIFSTAPADMHDRSDFLKYEAMWSKGPQVPVLLKVSIKDSTGAAIDAPKALGRTKFLWDWEDVAEDTSVHHAKAQAFLDKALDYHKDATKPKGDNCHKDRGGKRGGTNPVFVANAGYAPQDKVKDSAFPFKVEACPTRKWAAFSYGWGSGHFAGKTGVLLQPSRMAGDAVQVTVQVAYERKADKSAVLDVEDDPPLKAAVKAKTGIFQVWRQLDFVKYTKKKLGLPNFGVATFQGYYEKAFIRMKYTAGAATAMPAATYNSRFAAYVFGSAAPVVAAQPWYMQAAIDPAVDQHATGDLAVTFRTYAAWKVAAAAAQGWSAADLNAWLAAGGAALNTSSKYHGFCDNWAVGIVTYVCDAFIAASDGINLLHFVSLYNLEAQPGGSQLNGFATSFPSTGEHKCAFVLCAGAGNYGGDSNTREQTVTHEIGHCLFLAHAPDGVNAVDVANAPDAAVHDNAWHNCAMSYNYNQVRRFCGFCLLRLRGWDKTKLKPTAAQNKKP